MHPLIENLPSSPNIDSLNSIREITQQSNDCVVVLDDDPTGTQTVYDTTVLTTWDTATLESQLRRNEGMFYILTNSRAMTERDAVTLANELGGNLIAAATATNRRIRIISRSDSTLRGHYPAEVDAIAKATMTPGAVQIIMPFFLQGGRFTIDDVHYVAENDNLIPAADTPFAKDATFGFNHSDLKDWVTEKCDGRLARNSIHSVSIQDLRTLPAAKIADRLTNLDANSVVIANAVTIADARCFALAAHLAEQRGATFVYRTAASFVQAYAGLEERPLLNASDMVPSNNSAGLIVVGSYVPKTTAQLRCLLDRPDSPAAVVLQAEALLGSDGSNHDAASHLARAIDQVNDHLNKGRDVVLHTSRGLITGDDGESSLLIGTTISQAVVNAVRGVTAPLRFLIAKGGITSSDVATKALNAKRATVLGQILPGIPVWKLGQESRLPNLPYVVFPGNVGDDHALSQAYDKLKVKN